MRHRLDDPLSGRLYRSSDYPEVRMTDPTTDVPVERPNPLKDVATSVGTAWAALAGVIGAAVSFGFLNGQQADAINFIGTSLPGWILAVGTILGAVIPAAGTLIASFHVAKTAKSKVTPVDDPRDVDGHKLVRVDGGILGGRGVVTNVHERRSGDL